MGLREINATRTRQLIAQAALDLFVERGYDETTVEDVADRAGIGTSTVYRYFPTKDLLATAWLGDPHDLATALLARPADEPIEVALGHAIVDRLDGTLKTASPERSAVMRALPEQNSRVHARMVEWTFTMYDALVAAVAERRGADVDDTRVAAEAWQAVFVLQQVNHRRTNGDQRRPGLIAQAILTELGSQPVPVPRLDP